MAGLAAVVLVEPLGEFGIEWRIDARNSTRIDERDGFVIVTTSSGTVIWIPLARVKLVYP